MENNENIIDDYSEDSVEDQTEDQLFDQSEDQVEEEDPVEDQTEDHFVDQAEDQDEEEDFENVENVFMEDGENLIYENENSRSTSLYSQSSTVSDCSGFEQTVTIPDDYFSIVQNALYFNSFSLSIILGLLLFIIFSKSLK